VALFIELVIAPEAAKNPETVARLVESCPVDIFKAAANGALEIVEKNVDECTLCELCLAVGTPGQVQVLKLYDDRAPLERSA
jgi:NAD-dependent dihydropyrimidine dehydrogenase PreA subunit